MAEVSSLSALLMRLEAATTKLEDLALAGASASNVSASLTGNTGVSAAQESSQTYVEGFDELLDGPVKTYYELSKVIGSHVEEQVLTLIPWA